MKITTIGALAVASTGLYFACGAQSDISAPTGKSSTTSGTGTATGAGGSSATGGPTTGGPTTGTQTGAATGTGGSTAATTGAAGSPTTTGGGSGGMTNGTGGASGGSAGTSTVPDAGADASNKRAMDLIELADALKNLNGFTYTNPCKFSDTGKDVTVLAGCTTGEICWATANLGRFSETRQIAIGGPAGHVYDVDLNVLGVIEPRDYPPTPNCTFLPAQPLSTISVTQCTDGFTNQSSVTFNVYQFAVAAPAAKYYFNAVQTHPPHRVDLGDNKFTFTVNAATTITFTMDDLNGGEIRNCTFSAAQSKYTTAANSPFGNLAPIRAPTTVAQPYNGNWYTLSVIDARVR